MRRVGRTAGGQRAARRGVGTGRTPSPRPPPTTARRRSGLTADDGRTSHSPSDHSRALAMRGSTCPRAPMASGCPLHLTSPDPPPPAPVRERLVNDRPEARQEARRDPRRQQATPTRPRMPPAGQSAGATARRPARTQRESARSRDKRTAPPTRNGCIIRSPSDERGRPVTRETAPPWINCPQPPPNPTARSDASAPSRRSLPVRCAPRSGSTSMACSASRASMIPWPS